MKKKESWYFAAMYMPSAGQNAPNIQGRLLCAHRLELLGAVKELVGVSLGDNSPLVGLLDKEFVALLLGKVDGVVLGLEVQMCALHEVGG